MQDSQIFKYLIVLREAMLLLFEYKNLFVWGNDISIATCDTQPDILPLLHHHHLNYASDTFRTYKFKKTTRKDLEPFLRGCHAHNWWFLSSLMLLLVQWR